MTRDAERETQQEAENVALTMGTNGDPGMNAPTRKSAPKLTVKTGYGEFSRRTWRPYQFVLLVHGPGKTWSESWTEAVYPDRLQTAARKLREEYQSRERLRRENNQYMSWVPADFRAADYNFTIHRVSDGEEVWAF